MVDENEALKLT